MEAVFLWNGVKGHEEPKNSLKKNYPGNLCDEKGGDAVLQPYNP